MMAEQKREGLGGERGAEWDQQGDNWTLKLFSCLAAFTDMGGRHKGLDCVADDYFFQDKRKT